MVISSIDLKGGKVVQLKNGKEPVLSRTDADSLAAEFNIYGETAVIDLDAALTIIIDLMFEMSRARHHHTYALLVGFAYGVVVVYAAARLHDSGNAHLRRQLDTVVEGEEGIGC